MGEIAGFGPFAEASRRVVRPRVLLDDWVGRINIGAEIGIEVVTVGERGIEFERLGLDWTPMQYHQPMMLHPAPGLRLRHLTWWLH